MTEGRFDGMKDVGFRPEDFSRDPSGMRPEDYHNSIDEKIRNNDLEELAEKEQEEILAKLTESRVTLKPSTEYKQPPTGNLLDFLGEISEELEGCSGKAKATLTKEYSYEIQQKLAKVAPDAYSIGLIIETLQAIYLPKLEEEYRLAEGYEEDYEEMNRNNMWLDRNTKYTKLKERRLTAKAKLQKAQKTVSEVIPILEAIKKRL